MKGEAGQGGGLQRPQYSSAEWYGLSNHAIDRQIRLLVTC